MSNELLIGVLGLQGDIEENIKATSIALREMNLKRCKQSLTCKLLY